MNKKIITLLIALLIGLGTYLFEQKDVLVVNQEGEVVIMFPGDRYPETAEHIRSAIEKGKSAVCTIDRKNASKQREASLRGIPTKPGLDRDEWPMAMCKEGGKGADISYISPTDNRGAGSWVGNQVEKYPDGTRIKIVVN